MEVFAQVRVLNEFGGFFGQGTQVDVRQLRVSGVLGGKVRFNVGDIYLNQSRFTLHADDGEVFDPWGKAFEAQKNLVAYENFSRTTAGSCKGHMPTPCSWATLGGASRVGWLRHTAARVKTAL